MRWDRDAFDGHPSPSLRRSVVDAALHDQVEIRGVHREYGWPPPRTWPERRPKPRTTWTYPAGRPGEAEPFLIGCEYDNDAAQHLYVVHLLRTTGTNRVRLADQVKGFLSGRRAKRIESVLFVWWAYSIGAKRDQIADAFGWAPQRVSERSTEAKRLLGPIPRRGRRLLRKPDFPVITPSKEVISMTVEQRLERLERMAAEQLLLTRETASRLRDRFPTDSEISASVDTFLGVALSDHRPRKK
jgi:hypothetical protein